MKNYFFLKYLIAAVREYIFIFLTATILLIIIIPKTFSQENVFIINNVEIEAALDVNFSREKYINKAFIDSFEILKSRVLLSRDLNKMSNMKLSEIRNLINSFQILEETYRNEKYKAKFKIFFSEKKVKKLLGKENISFSQPNNISVIFFPALFINEQIQDFNENFFYKQWKVIKIKNETINFIMPLEDLDDFLKIKEAKNKIEELNINDLVNKYDVENYVFALMDFQNQKLNIHLKMWKEENIVNLSIPLTIKIKFQYNNLSNLDKLKKTFYKISIIDNYSLEELSINNSLFKIYYYGNPKRLKTELLKFGYQLNNDHGHWALYKND